MIIYVFCKIPKNIFVSLFGLVQGWTVCVCGWLWRFVDVVQRVEKIIKIRIVGILWACVVFLTESNGKDDWIWMADEVCWGASKCGSWRSLEEWAMCSRFKANWGVFLVGFEKRLAFPSLFTHSLAAHVGHHSWDTPAGSTTRTCTGCPCDRPVGCKPRAARAQCQPRRRLAARWTSDGCSPAWGGSGASGDGVAAFGWGWSWKNLKNKFEK